MNAIKRNLALAVTAMILFLGTGAFAADTFKIDPVHSSATFKIRHLGISNVTGDFSGIAGVILVDKKNPAKSSVEVTIKTDSVNTNNEMRDKDLRSPNFFDTGNFPEMSFKSTKVRKISAKKFEVSGDFTLHGVTKKIKVSVDFLGEGKGMKGEPRAGFETSFKIKRSDYGMKADIPLVGDEVQITFSAEAVKQ